MYNFVTTTLINNLTYGKKKEDLLTIWSSASASTATASDGAGTTTVGTSDTSKLDGFSIKRVRDFYKNKLGESVISIYKAAGTEERFAEADINLGSYFTAAASTDNALVGHYRLTLYVGLEGSENPYYANDLVFKGKPFYVEFEVKAGDTADKIAARIKKFADKYIAMVYEDAILDLSVCVADATAFGQVNLGSAKTPNGTTTVTKHLYITGTDEYQRIRVAQIEKFVDGTWAMEGSFEPVLSLYQVKDWNPDTAADVTRTLDDAVGTAITVTQGRQGFGTYHHLMKDYRLPTAANTRWIKIQADETPVLNTIYNQYTITYCSERGNMGTSVVGEPTKSVTTHVFWVANDLADKFEAGLTALGWANGDSGDTNKNGVIDTVPTSETKAS